MAKSSQLFLIVHFPSPSDFPELYICIVEENVIFILNKQGYVTD